MEIKFLEHVNLRTAEMEKLAVWYERILGLKRGYRPPFGVKGLWLYADAIPIVHLLELDSPPATRDPQIEHFAMRASGLESFLERLKEDKISYRTARVPELRVFQIYLSDPENNHMHIDFPPQEADDLGFE
jgi:catechol-2,3-dioxygenase